MTICWKHHFQTPIDIGMIISFQGRTGTVDPRNEGQTLKSAIKKNAIEGVKGPLSFTVKPSPPTITATDFQEERRRLEPRCIRAHSQVRAGTAKYTCNSNSLDGQGRPLDDSVMDVSSNSPFQHSESSVDISSTIGPDPGVIESQTASPKSGVIPFVCSGYTCICRKTARLPGLNIPILDLNVVVINNAAGFDAFLPNLRRRTGAQKPSLRARSTMVMRNSKFT